MDKNLVNNSCEACREDVPILSESEINNLMNQIPSWCVIEEAESKKLVCSFAFINYEDSVSFANKIATLAEEEDHHPEILLEWGKVCLLYTSPSPRD